MNLKRLGAIALIGTLGLGAAACTDGYGYGGVGYASDGYYAAATAIIMVAMADTAARRISAGMATIIIPAPVFTFTIAIAAVPLEWCATAVLAGPRQRLLEREPRRSSTDSQQLAGFPRDVRDDRQDYRGDVRDARQDYRQGEINRDQFQDRRQGARQDYRGDVRQERRQLGRQNRRVIRR